MRFEFGSRCLDDQQFTLTGPEGLVHIEPQVFSVLRHLIVNAHRVVSKEELLDDVWGDRFVSESALTSRIKAARRAVGDDGQAQRVIRTVHGRGYQFVAPVTVVVEEVRSALPALRGEPIGRDVDVEGVLDRVRSAPLVTIVGPGGVGKTTVALLAAHRLRSEAADGAVFVDLAAVPRDGDVTGAIADAAEVQGDAARSLHGVADHLARRPVLLVLDNCEHVLAGAAAVVDRMLERGTMARILATSREPLRVTGEHVWPLGPLGDAGPALFVERALAAEPRVAWDATDPQVVELCARLDNVPLALELAAGQLRRFQLDELSRRLSSQLSLLARRAAGDSQRHATMEAATDWSYQLLDPEEQCLLRHLSVFPASFDLDAVEASAPSSAGPSVAAVLGELVDKSLVVRDPTTGRYRLLETIRAFAKTRLDQAGEAASAIERHRRHVRERVGGSSRLDRWLSARAAAAYRADLHNAREAFRVSLAGGHLADAVEIAIGGTFLWRNAIGCTEGNGWVEALLAAELSARDRLWVHILRADVGQGRGDHRQMFGAAADAQRAAAGADDAAGACLAAHYAALVHLTDPDRAADPLHAALDLARASGDPRLGTLLQGFFTVADVAAGQYEPAHARIDALDQDASEDGYDRFILHWAGWLLGLAERDALEARRWMGLQQEYLDRTGIVETWITSYSTAMCEVIEGRDVRERLRRTLALADREGYEADADCLLVLAYSEACAGRLESAAELVGIAVTSGFNSTAHHVLYRAVLDHPLRQHLTADQLEAALTRGRRRVAREALAAHGVGR
jgi:predicted ATPase